MNSAVDVYNSLGVLIATNDNFGNMTVNSRVTINVVAGESYFVRVRGVGSSMGDYAMSVDWLLAGGL